MSYPSQDDLPPSTRTRSSRFRTSTAIPPPTPTRRSVRLGGGPDSAMTNVPSTPRKSHLMDGNLIQTLPFRDAPGVGNAPSAPQVSHHAHPSPPPLAMTPTMPSPYPGGYGQMSNIPSSPTPVRASKYTPTPPVPTPAIRSTNMPSIGTVLNGHRPNPFSSSPASPSGLSTMLPLHLMGASPFGRPYDLESSPTITPKSYTLQKLNSSGQFLAGLGHDCDQTPFGSSPASFGQLSNPFMNLPSAQLPNKIPVARPKNTGRSIATSSLAHHLPSEDMSVVASSLANPRLATALGIRPSNGPFSHSIRTTTAPYIPSNPNWPDPTVGASLERDISVRQAKKNWDAMGGAEGVRDALRAQEECHGDTGMEGYNAEDQTVKNIRAAAISGPPPLRPGYGNTKKHLAPPTSTSCRSNPLVKAAERAQQPSNTSLPSVEAARRSWTTMSATIKEEMVEGGNSDQMDINEGNVKRRKTEVEQESEDISPKVVEQAVQDMQGITGQIAAAFDHSIAPATPIFSGFLNVTSIPQFLDQFANVIATHALQPHPTIEPNELHQEGPIVPLDLTAVAKAAKHLSTHAPILTPASALRFYQASTSSPLPLLILQNTYTSSSTKPQKPCSDCADLNFSRLTNHEQGNVIRCKECKRDLLLPDPANKYPCPDVSQKKDFLEWKNGSYYDEKADKLFMEQMVGLGFLERVSVKGKEVGVKRDNLEKWKVSKKIVWDGDDYVWEVDMGVDEDEYGDLLEGVDIEMDIEEEFGKVEILL
ncbi:hypothetical protein BGZ60DRAFT_430671 [Tricladium varicosporioides]|nr:hypothetical protein BGZ60DRAFT_430671 [Hymenoscyphus varicosporioides]